MNRKAVTILSTLNNRGAGFTRGPNGFAPGKRPVHTLAPILVEGDFGIVGVATPGADGQIQTLKDPYHWTSDTGQAPETASGQDDVPLPAPSGGR